MLSVVQAQTTLETVQAQRINVGVARAEFEHAIATLVGKPASGFSIPVKPMTTSPPPIPIGLPSQLLERRPDIAAAERSMAEANAQIGIAKAAYYPTLTLSASGRAGSFDARQPFCVVQPLLGDRRDPFRDALRRRPSPCNGQSVHCYLQRSSRILPADGTNRVPAGGGRAGDCKNSFPASLAATVGRRIRQRGVNSN